MLLRITHTTRYTYDQPVVYALQQVRLTPRDTRQQIVRDWVITLDGGKKETAYTDQHGTLTDLVSVTPGGTEIAITAHGTVETQDTAGVLGQAYGRTPLWYFMKSTALTAAGDAIGDISRQVARHDSLLEGLHALSAAILSAAPYRIGETYSATSAEAALTGGSGVCQDHAQIFVAAARAAGVPARYVSGYLMMNDRVDQDASHAWAEAHVDGLGWVGFDISNGISPDARYVRLAVGLDYREAAPLSGMRMGDANESMIVSLQIQQ